MKKHIVLASLAAAFVAAGAASAQIAETIRLAPKNASGVTGTATVSSPGDRAAAKVVVRLRGLKAGAAVRVLLNGGDGKRPGASVIRVLSARANAKGSLAAQGRTYYRGTPVTFATIADGDHRISIVVEGKVVASGVVPGIS